MPGPSRRDDGSILLLALGLLVVALLLVLAVVDASAVYLTRRALAAAADGAAVAAADRPDLAAVYATGAVGPLRLDPAAVSVDVSRFQRAGGYPADWTFTATTLGGSTAVVRVSAVLALPVVGRVRVSATSEAQAS
jgi:uncharacterized membrane protein